MDENSSVYNLTKEILMRRSVRLAGGNAMALQMDPLLGNGVGNTNIIPVEMYRDLDILSQQITEAIFLLLNDPSYYC